MRISWRIISCGMIRWSTINCGISFGSVTRNAWCSPGVDSDYRLEPADRAAFETSLDALLSVIDKSADGAALRKYQPYIRLCDALRTLTRSQPEADPSSAPPATSADRDALLQATNRLMDSLTSSASGPPEELISRSLQCRPIRLKICRKALYIAASGQRDEPAEDKPDVLTNPFRPGGAESAYRFLRFIQQQDLAPDAVDDDFSGLLSQAAYYLRRN